MSLIKATRINHLTDARYFAVFAEWVGFNFEPNTPHYISASTARELIGWLSGVRIIGEFGCSPIAHINSIVEMLQLDTIEVSHTLQLDGLSPIVSSIIRRVSMTHPSDWAALEQYIKAHENSTSAFVLDFSASTDNNSLLQSALLQDWCKKYRLIIATPFNMDNITPILHGLQPFGIELQGSSEETTGMKTFDELNELVELIVE
jgi:phosphoribosylanthranilate isomerase